MGTRLIVSLFAVAAIVLAAFVSLPRQRIAPGPENETTPAAIAPSPAGKPTLAAPPSVPVAAGNVTPPPHPETSGPQTAAQGAFSWDPLIARLQRDGFDETAVRASFKALQSPPLPEFMAYKAIELNGGKGSLAVEARKGESFAPPDYSRVAGGVSAESGRRLLTQNQKFFTSLYKQYGVPGNFIIAILMVETGVGAQLGTQPALLSLGSMATTRSLADVLPVLNGVGADNTKLSQEVGKRSEWAYDELKALLKYAQAVGKKPESIPGSVFGAIGICQFMPSNITRYGASTRGKKTVDVFHFPDAAASVARYLSAHGWRKSYTPQAQLAVLRSYNLSDVYASTVYGVAMAIASSGSLSAQRANGGNIVKAARDSARGALPFHKTLKGKPLEPLPSYSSLLE